MDVRGVSNSYVQVYFMLPNKLDLLRSCLEAPVENLWWALGHMQKYM